MTRRFSSISVQTTLATGISNTALSCTVAVGTAATLLGGISLAAGDVDQFKVILDPDTPSAEIVYVTGVTSDTLTLQRGKDGTSMIAHLGGAKIRHVLTGEDLTYLTTGVASVSNLAAGLSFPGSTSGTNMLKAPAVAGTVTTTLPAATGTLMTIESIDSATSKTTPDDADEIPLADSAATFGLKKLTWANLKATLKAYFDPFYLTYIAQNGLLNADFYINQGAFTSNTGNLAYNFDQWLQQNSGGTVTVTPQTFTPGAAPVAGVEGKNYVQIVTATQSAAGDYAMLTQRIEDVRKYAGQTVVVSFYAGAGSGTPSVAVELNQNFGAGGAPSTAVSTPMGAKAIAVGWGRYYVSVAVPSISGKTIGTTPDTAYLEVNLWLSSGATNATRASSIGIQNNTFNVWGVKIEPGTAPTAFSTNAPNRAAELLACYRYYFRDVAFSNRAIFGFNNSTTVHYGTWNLPVTMRSAPSSAISNIANFYVRIKADTNNAITAFSFTGQEKNAVWFSATSSGLTAGEAGFLVNKNSDGTSYLEANARL